MKPSLVKGSLRSFHANLGEGTLNPKTLKSFHAAFSFWGSVPTTRGKGGGPQDLYVLRRLADVVQPLIRRFTADETEPRLRKWRVGQLEHWVRVKVVVGAPKWQEGLLFVSFENGQRVNNLKNKRWTSSKNTTPAEKSPTCKLPRALWKTQLGFQWPGSLVSRVIQGATY